MSRSTLALLSLVTMATVGTAGVASLGCSPGRAASTETTAARVANAADVEQPAARESARDEQGERGEQGESASLGQLVCRSKSATSGTTELYLGTWGEDGAKGFLRTLAPSGMAYTQRVHAERYKDAIVVDEPDATDLVSHAAVVARQNGKQQIRLGDAQQPWLACE